MNVKKIPENLGHYFQPTIVVLRQDSHEDFLKPDVH